MNSTRAERLCTCLPLDWYMSQLASADDETDSKTKTESETDTNSNETAHDTQSNTTNTNTDTNMNINQTDSDSDSDSQSSCPDDDTHQPCLDEGLQQVRQNVSKQLHRIERDGEQIKQIVGHALIGERADSDLAMDLRREIASQITEVCNSTDDVTLNEITLALWAELYRVSEMVTGDTESETDADGSADDEGSESDSSERTTVEDDSRAPRGRGVGAMFADGSADDDETSPAETDPAFQ
jgi:hypothetical protein